MTPGTPLKHRQQSVDAPPMLKRRWSSLDDMHGTCNECRAEDVRLLPCDACNAWLYRDLGPATPGGTLPRIKAFYCENCHYDRLCVKCYAGCRSKANISGDGLRAELLGLFPRYYDAVPGTLKGEELVPNPLYKGWARQELLSVYIYGHPEPPFEMVCWQDLCQFCRSASNRILWRKGVPRGCTCVVTVKTYIKLL